MVDLSALVGSRKFNRQIRCPHLGKMSSLVSQGYEFRKLHVGHFSFFSGIVCPGMSALYAVGFWSVVVVYIPGTNPVDPSQEIRKLIWRLQDMLSTLWVTVSAKGNCHWYLRSFSHKVSSRGCRALLFFKVIGERSWKNNIVLWLKVIASFCLALAKITSFRPNLWKQ